MKQFAIFLIFTILSASNTSAQTYTEHVQKKVEGHGTVTVNQSKEIDELVNGTKQVRQNTNTATIPTAKSQNNVTKKPKGTSVAAERHKQDTSKKENHTTEESKQQQQNEKDSANKEESNKHETAKKPETSASDDEEDMNIPVIDLRKKVMRKSYKVIGYRVQAFSGGNSRQDKIKAQQTGNDIKMQFPDEPIYVHFYSPRWICRVGNFRSYEEANRMLIQIHKMGYKSASIVRGKITLQY